MNKKVGFMAGQVGDLVMCSVAAKQFKLQNPNDHLIFAIGGKYGHVKDLFQGLPYIDNFHIWESYDGWPSDKDIEFIHKIGPKDVFNPFPAHTRPDWYNHYHYVEETCLMLGLQKPVNLQCELGYKPKKIDGLDKTITMSLFASGNQPYKTLNPDKMSRLVSGLVALGYDVVQIGYTDLPIEGAKNFTGDIFAAVDMMCSAKVHITIDTAFSWIASAYSRPLVGLYGINYADMPLNRVVSHNPVNPNATYINDYTVDNIGVDRIIENVKKYL